MSIRLNVINGTLGDSHKCDQCSHAHQVTDSHNNEHTFCKMIGVSVKRKIVSCNSFKSKMESWEHLKFASQAYLFHQDYDGNYYVTDSQGKQMNIRNGKLVPRRRSLRRRAVKTTVSRNPVKKMVN